MCNTCGCDHDHEHDVETKTVDVNQSLLKANEDAAIANKKHFDEKGIYVMNLISSPGSGKTTLLEKTIETMKDEISIGVLEGDIETDLDAERIRAKGVPAVQLTTGGACHLESPLVHKGFHELEHQLDGKKLNLLFIENVGNLVCPSFFDLGEHIRVVLISIPEGHDKPLKYPKALRTSSVLMISKSDLVPHFNFDIEKAKKDALSINPSLKIFVTSATTGEGMDEWLQFLRSLLSNRTCC
ncbi:MAG TPA: hydrogenase accessory protein HypB [Nitrospirae bacterium]|nr:hydrogenase accessory protein HypB [Nitrospirota bacterium]HDO67500.1 hydrogenase accessory protein HypB [Nitrospirota bacterium]HEW81674.1 hydrogenase accessory protein HypB [Nitrospirota bacterium]